MAIKIDKITKIILQETMHPKKKKHTNIKGPFGVTFRRRSFERRSFKKMSFRGITFKRMIFVWFEYVKSKFRRMSFVWIG